MRWPRFIMGALLALNLMQVLDIYKEQRRMERHEIFVYLIARVIEIIALYAGGFFD